jgi:para-nitrobenzyl esterase
MRHILFLTISIFLSFATFTSVLNGQAPNIKEPTVKTNSGWLKGISNDTVSVFKGIPFAAPPVGEYRWRPPQAVVPWQGVRNATEFGPNCAQAGWGGTPGTITKNSAEDCLYLNVWKPANVSSAFKLPVMIWIHGGGFVGGSGAEPTNFGDQFAKQGVILVTINYRLGRLGFFAHPMLSNEYPNEPKGNYGYMDQIAALEWVKENIAAFGGDPNNVTIFGQSAGGVSVHSLLTIPDAKGLFHKAISHSGGGRDGVLTGRPINKENADPFYTVSAETIGVNFARKHGITENDTDALVKLRQMRVEDIVDGGQETDGQGGPRIYSGPILDGKLVVETAESAYKAGRFVKVPLMIGSCNAEISGNFVNMSQTKDELFSIFGSLQNEARAAYDPEGTNEFAEVLTKFNSDWVWGEPARMTAKAFTNHGMPAYIYLFSYVPNSLKERMKYGAGHGSEVAYTFNNLSTRWGVAETTSTDQTLAQMMNTYWVNFAKTGNPNGSHLPNWPKYSIIKNQILEFKADGKPGSSSDMRSTRLDVIEKSVLIRNKLQTRGI